MLPTSSSEQVDEALDDDKSGHSFKARRMPMIGEILLPKVGDGLGFPFPHVLSGGKMKK